MEMTCVLYEKNKKILEGPINVGRAQITKLGYKNNKNDQMFILQIDFLDKNYVESFHFKKDFNLENGKSFINDFYGKKYNELKKRIQTLKEKILSNVNYMKRLKEAENYLEGDKSDFIYCEEILDELESLSRSIFKDLLPRVGRK